jgi:HlyD family secretion protein
LLRRLLIVVLLLVGLIAWLLVRRSGPPEVPFTKVKREMIESTLTTNGKVEPVEWAAARAESAGTVAKVDVQRGAQVARGQLLVELDVSQAREQLASAEARVAQAKAELDVLMRGGKSSELAEIENGLIAAKSELTTAKRDSDSLSRLLSKQAATAYEMGLSRDKVRQIELRIEGLERRRAALVGQSDRAVAEAKINEMEAAAAEIRHRVEVSNIRSPMSGMLYQFDLKPGAYLNPGDLVGSVGRINQLKVTVYVDEPELGRVEKGMPVNITWDAMAGRQWKGVVDRMPTQIVPLGTRQVGEVVCIIENPDLSLIPGTNINAEVLSRKADSALTIPKETVHTEGKQSYVMKLVGDRLITQPVKLGIGSITRIQVLQGLSEGESIALPIERVLKNNEAVKPTYPE